MAELKVQKEAGRIKYWEVTCEVGVWHYSCTTDKCWMVLTEAAGAKMVPLTWARRCWFNNYDPASKNVLTTSEKENSTMAVQ